MKSTTIGPHHSPTLFSFSVPNFPLLYFYFHIFLRIPPSQKPSHYISLQSLIFLCTNYHHLPYISVTPGHVGCCCSGPWICWLLLS
ncbi:hypothetical protein L1887_19742 [Cichorium endivia]|nr:hypothetical protein L1887_19742 [Cichorium endivia]